MSVSPNSANAGGRGGSSAAAAQQQKKRRSHNDGQPLSPLQREQMQQQQQQLAAAQQQQQQQQQQMSADMSVAEYKYSPLQPHFAQAHGIRSSSIRSSSSTYSGESLINGSPLASSTAAGTNGFDGAVTGDDDAADNDDDEQGEDRLEHMPVSQEAYAEAAALTAAAPQPAELHHPHAQLLHQHNTGGHHATMHNNFTDNGSSPSDAATTIPAVSAGGGGGGGGSGSASAGNSKRNAVRAAAAQQAQVFENLYNPKNYTGAQKAKFESGVQRQAGSSSIAGNDASKLSSSKGRNQPAGAGTAAGVTPSSGAAVLLNGNAIQSAIPSLAHGGKKLLSTVSMTSGNAAASSGAANSGGPLLASQLSGSQSARLLAAAAAAGVGAGFERSPSPGSTNSSSDADHGGGGIAALQASKVPIHERLSDPRYFTGAQKQKFQEERGVKGSIRVGGSGGALGLRDQIPSVPLGGRERIDSMDGVAAGAATGRPAHMAHKSFDMRNASPEEVAALRAGGGSSSSSLSSGAGGGGLNSSRRAARHGGGGGGAAMREEPHSGKSAGTASPADLPIRQLSPTPLVGASTSSGGNLLTDKENHERSSSQQHQQQQQSGSGGDDDDADTSSKPLVGRHDSLRVTDIPDDEAEADVAAGDDGDQVVVPPFFVSPRTEMHDARANAATEASN